MSACVCFSIAMISSPGCFPSKMRAGGGAVKLHLLLDHDGYLPCYAVVTEGVKGEFSRITGSVEFDPSNPAVFQVEATIDSRP